MLSCETTKSKPISGLHIFQLLNQSQFLKAASFFKDKEKVQKAEELESAWQSVVSQAGSYLNLGKQSSTYVGNYLKEDFTLNFERQIILLTVISSRSGVPKEVIFQTLKSYKDKKKQAAYVKKNLFSEKNVSIGNSKWKIPGLITVPKPRGRYPAVIFVHDLGVGDKDGTFGNNRIFQDLAWGLGSKGVISVRFDKRVYAHSDKLSQKNRNMTVNEETIDDVISAVNLLSSHRKVNASRIFLIGHGLGGTLVPRILSRDPRIHGSISINAPSRKLEQVQLNKMMRLLMMDGVIDTKERLAYTSLSQKFKKVRELNLNTPVKSQELPLNLGPQYWLDMRAYDPFQWTHRIRHKPMLFLQGERDFETTLQDFETWEKKLSKNNKAQFKLYENLNHIMVFGNGPSTPQEYFIPKHLAPQVLDDIYNWIIQK